MNLTIRPLRRQDYRTISRFALVGMHFDWYFPPGRLLDLIGYHFFLSQLIRSTQVLAAWQGDRLAGVLLAAMDHEPLLPSPWHHRVFVRFFDALSALTGKDALEDYDRTNAAMLEAFRRTAATEGELCFLACDPALQGAGVGTFLLEELARREPGRTVFLFTDDACTYQFYEHRGFRRSGREEITLALRDRTVSLQCLLYTKTL